jgi:hypothetical protein
MGHLPKFDSKSLQPQQLTPKEGVPKAVPNGFPVGHLVGQPFEGLIRSKDAARALGMSEWSLRNLAHSGELAYIQRNGPRSPMLFDPLDLRAWVEREKIRK